MTTTLETYANQILDADNYVDLFVNEKDAETEYRVLARYVHPDMYAGQPVEQALATKAFQKLVEFRAESVQMAAESRWGDRRLLATITSRKGRYEVTRALADGDLAKLWVATARVDNGADSVIVKVAKSAKDNDLLAQEARALKLLQKEEHPLNRHFPVLVDTFLHSEGRRRTNVQENMMGFAPLTEVVTWFNDSIPGPHLAWIWRKLLMALGYAHDQGLFHGAVVPSHILVHPELHAVVLVDWCYSGVIVSETKTYVKAMVPMFKHWYPEEVRNKETPSAATDLYMAAGAMLWSAASLPRAMQAYFKGTMLTKQSMRPQNAWLLLEEFDELLKVLGGPYYPRRFVEMPVPARVGS